MAVAALKIKKAFFITIGIGIAVFGAQPKKESQNSAQTSSVSEAIEKGRFLGYVRLHQITGGDPVAQNGSAVGIKLKYETAPLKGVSAGVAFYSAHDTGLTKVETDPVQGLVGDDWNGYDTLGEVYLNYKISKTNFRVGRQEFKTPMTQNIVTLIPNLFEGASASFGEIDDLALGVSHITRIQYGTRAGADKLLIGDGTFGLTAGAGEGLERATGKFGTNTTKGKNTFMPLHKAALGKDAKESAGMSVLELSYTGFKGAKLQFWDYYTWDIMNTIYLEGDYRTRISDVLVNISTQYLNQKDVGNYPLSSPIRARLNKYNPSTGKFVAQNLWAQMIDKDGNINSSLYGAKLEASAYGLTLCGAVNKNEGGHVINPFGGDPAYTSMIFARNNYRADTNSYKLKIKYDMSRLGIKGLTIDASRAEFYSKAVYFTSQTADTTIARNEKTKVYDYMITYVPPSLRALTIVFLAETKESETREFDLHHGRLVVNYNF